MNPALLFIAATCAACVAACEDEGRMAGDDPLQDARDARDRSYTDTSPSTLPPGPVTTPEADTAPPAAGTLSNGRGGSPTPQPDPDPG